MEIIGWIGTSLVIAAYYPQIRHLQVEKCAWGLSITTWVIWLVSSVFLMTYSILRGDILFVAVQGINILAIAATIFLARRSDQVCPHHLTYGRSVADERNANRDLDRRSLEPAVRRLS